jgi:hypothetical protein
MSNQSIQEKEAWALKVMELEEGCNISAGNKTISDMLEMLRLQKAASSPESAIESAIETAKQSGTKSSRPRAVKPALSK